MVSVRVAVVSGKWSVDFSVVDDGFLFVAVVVTRLSEMVNSSVIMAEMAGVIGTVLFK